MNAEAHADSTDRQVQARERSRRKLRIGRGFSLDPEEFIESCTAILAKRGMGKTGAAKVAEEECIRAHVPFVALDPIGTHWGLRSSFDGKADGLKVLVVGGSHADIPFDRHAGAMIADAVVAANVPTIIDYSDESHSAAREFVGDFAAELYKKNDTGRLVIIEEASELLPQRLRPDMTTVYDSVERVVTRGRNRGLGVLLIDQRPARINKDVLTQIDSLWIMGVTSPQDRKALREWVEARADTSRLEAFMEGISACKRQEAWIWSPGSDIFQKVHIRNFRTLHPDKTHLRRLGILNARAVTTDVSSLVAKLGKDMERLAKEKADVAAVPKLKSTAERLQREVDQLKKQRDELTHIAAQSKDRPPSEREIARVVNEAVAPYKRQTSEQQHEITFLRKAVEKIKVAVETIDLDRQFVKAIEPRAPPMPEPKPAPAVTVQEARELRWPPAVVPEPAAPDPAGENGVRIMPAHIRILSALVTLKDLGVDRPSREQAALWAGASPKSSAYANNLGALRTVGYIDYAGPGVLKITGLGHQFFDDLPQRPQTPSTASEAREQVFRILRGRRADILKVALDAYPNAIPKPDLAQRAGVSYTSSAYANNLGSLRSMGLIDYVDGQVVATGVLLP